MFKTNKIKVNMNKAGM